MNKVIIFKKLMHEPMLVEGSGNIDKLSETVGEYNVERLEGLGVIKVENGLFELTESGKRMIELFNQ